VRGRARAAARGAVRVNERVHHPRRRRARPCQRVRDLRGQSNMTIKLNNLRNQERDTMRTALTVLSSLAATRAEMIEAEQERAETIIADSMAIERAAEDVHELLEQACAARGLNTAGPTKELVTRLA